MIIRFEGKAPETLQNILNIEMKCFILITMEVLLCLNIPKVWGNTDW